MATARRIAFSFVDAGTCLSFEYCPIQSRDVSKQHIYETAPRTKPRPTTTKHVLTKLVLWHTMHLPSRVPISASAMAKYLAGQSPVKGGEKGIGGGEHVSVLTYCESEASSRACHCGHCMIEGLLANVYMAMAVSRLESVACVNQHTEKSSQSSKQR